MHQTTDFVANLDWWANWDGDWYLSINQYGYGAPGVPEWTANVAFFPAFPQMVGVLSKVIPLQPLYIGLILNVLLTIITAYLLAKLAIWLSGHFGITKQRDQRTIAVLSIMALLAFPSSFFLAAYYAESCLVLGFVGAVYFALTKRLWLSVPFMILASASKVTGMVATATVGVIVLEQWWRERPHHLPILAGRWAITCLGAAGLVAYSVYLKITFNSALLFYHIEKLWGRNTGEEFFIPSIARGYYAHFFDAAHFGGAYNYNMLLMLMVLPFLVLATVVWILIRFKTFWPLVLGVLILGLPMSSGLIEGINRYCLALAPILPLIFIGLRGKVRTPLLYVALGISFGGMVAFGWGFLDGAIFAG